MSQPSVGSALLNVPTPYGIAEASSWIALQTSPLAPCLPILGIRLHFPGDAGLYIGSVALTKRAASGEKPIYELGYSLNPEYWGMGIMKDAVVAVMTWATEEVGVDEVYVRIQEVNVRSKGVLNGVPQFKREEDQPINWRGFQTVTGMWRWKASNTNV
jgi:RimJ/RimL family protein N-acetyltransferase